MESGALSGLLVADFTRVLAGPYATMLLADLGATVIKVERPGTGDDTRAWAPPFAPDGQSTYYQSVNRNKLSVALDLSDPEDLRVAKDLAGAADILVENHKSDGLRRFGLDYDSVRAANPGVVYCSISGFGSDAGKDLPGYDLLVQAMGGLMSVTGTDVPTKAGVAVVDVLTGLHATVGILAALHHRQDTGDGQRIEVSLLGALLSSMVNQSGAHVAAGVVPGLLGNAHPSIAPYELYATADRPIVLAVGNDTQFRKLAAVLGRPELAESNDYRTNSARVANRPALKSALEDRLRERGADEWERLLNQAGVPCGPINDLAQSFDLARRLGLNPVVTIEDGERTVGQVANPVDYSATPATYRIAPPHLGQNREQVIAILERRQEES